MKKTTRQNSILVCALLGIMMAGLAQGATLRFSGSGDYTNVLSSSPNGVGWTPDGGGPGGLPGSADVIRVNMADNTVTLSNVAPNIAQFQLGVDESGTLVVESGGSLTAIGASANNVGNNKTGVTGRLNVMTNGVVNSSAVLRVGYGNAASGAATGILTIDGGTVNASNHLWVGAFSGASGTIILTNGGTLNMLGVGGNGMLGLGTGNASSPSGGTGILKVSDGGVFNGYNISASAGQPSIQPGSVLDISGSGVVTFPGDKVATISAYTNAGKITAYGGTGTVGIDFNNTNVGKTTLWAIVGYTPPTEVVWNPAGNPSGTGKWNEGANWTGGGGYPPVSVTKVIFNVVGATSCTVTNVAAANHVLMGTNGPGGTLIINSGGSLACGAGNASVIGQNSNALMTVETGASASFGGQLRIGLDPESDGTLVMNGGTVSVAGLFDLGAQGGKGTAQIKGGTLNLAQWDELVWPIQVGSVLDVSGTGKVVINGDHQFSVGSLVSGGQITNSSGAGLIVDYNVINVGKTTIYPAGLYVAPERATWDPASNPSGSGLWNECDNWAGGSGLCPGNVTIVNFNVFGAIPCTVTNAAVARYVSIGQGGEGGTLIITNGGSLTCGSDNWTSIGRNNTGQMIVENDCSVSLGDHLWIGLDPSGDGTLIMNGGTMSVAGMFSCGWLGGKGTALINGGTLNLSQWHATDSIKTATSLLNVGGTGKVVINGNWFTSVSNYVSAGKITANGGTNVYYAYYPSTGKTVLSAVVLPPPPQSITAVSVSGGNVTITYQTTAQNTYYIEGTPSLSPSSWTPVPGSTNTATGTPVTFTFPASGNQMFYRTVSP